MKKGIGGWIVWKSYPVSPVGSVITVGVACKVVHAGRGKGMKGRSRGVQVDKGRILLAHRVEGRMGRRVRRCARAVVKVLAHVRYRMFRLDASGPPRLLPKRPREQKLVQESHEGSRLLMPSLHLAFSLLLSPLFYFLPRLYITSTSLPHPLPSTPSSVPAS